MGTEADIKWMKRALELACMAEAAGEVPVGGVEPVTVISNVFRRGKGLADLARFEIQAFPGGLKATAWGEPIDAEKHQPAVEVKAATFADLKVARDGAGMWMAQCVVDV